MATIIRAGQENSINVSVPQVVLIEEEPAVSTRAASTNIAGVVLQSTRGDTDTIYTAGSIEDFIRDGGSFLDGLDGYNYVKDFFDSNGGTLKWVRVASGTVEAASVTLSGSAAASGGAFTLTFETGGTYGNSTVAVVSNAVLADYFDIEIRNGKERRVYEKVTTLSTDDRYIETMINQDIEKFFDITMIDSSGDNPVTGSSSFSGGTNGSATGTSLDDSAYIGTDDGTRTGIQLFKEDDEVILVESARSNATINTELENHVNNTDLSPRRTILTFAEGTTVAAAIAAMATVDNDKIKYVYNYPKIRNVSTKIKENRNPTAMAAAYDTLVNYNISMSQAKLAATVIDLERNLTSTEVAQLTKARINPIVKKKGRGFIFASDYTGSSLPAKSQNSTRKAKDFFAISIASGLEPLISRPIDQELWDEMKNSIVSFLENEARAGRIGRSNGSTPYSVKIDTDNNPQSVVQNNRVIIEIEISLKGHADLILVYMDASIDKTIVNTN